MRLHWGPLRGLSLTWLYLILCAIACLKSKNKRWKYVYRCLFPSSFSFLNVSGEISPTPGLERNLR